MSKSEISCLRHTQKHWSMQAKRPDEQRGKGNENMVQLENVKWDWAGGGGEGNVDSDISELEDWVSLENLSEILFHPDCQTHAL